MRLAGLLLAGLFAAGCLGPGPASVGEVLPVGPDLASFEACPTIEGLTVPCDLDQTTNLVVDTEDGVPTPWTCVSFADRRFGDAQAYPWPDWYTYLGPARMDGAAEPSLQLGFLYDTRNETRTVSGVAHVVSEDGSPIVQWSGPASAFVRLPVPITRQEIWVVGVLYAGDVGYVNETRIDPQVDMAGTRHLFNTTGFAADPPHQVWSLRDYEDPEFQQNRGPAFDLVQVASSAGHRYHFPAQQEHRAAFLDPSDVAGSAHWGMGRQFPFNTTVSGAGFAVEGSLQPFMFFSLHVADHTSPLFLATMAFMCGCGDEPVGSVEWVRCQPGLPVAAQADGRGLQVAVDSTSTPT